MPKTLLNPYRNNLSIVGITERHDELLDQSVKRTSNVVFNDITATGDTVFSGNLLVHGNVEFTGTESRIETDVIVIKDQIIDINGDNDPLQLGGMKINRGIGLDPYYILYEESSGSFKLGKQGSLQTIATRGSNLVDKNILVWDSSTNSFVSTDTLDIPLNFTVPVTMSKLHLKNGAFQNDIFTDTAGDIILDSTRNVSVKKDLIVGSQLSLGDLVTFSANAQGSLLIDSQTLDLQQSALLKWGGRAAIRSTANGNDVSLNGDYIYIETDTILSSGKSLSFGDVGTIQNVSGSVFQVSSSGDIHFITPSIVKVPNLNLGDSVSLTVNGSGQLLVDTLDDIVLSPFLNVILSSGKKLSFDCGSLYSDTNDMFLTSSQNLILDANIVKITGNRKLCFRDYTTIFEDTNGDSVLENTTQNIVVRAGNSKSLQLYGALQFGIGNEKMSSNGLDITLQSSSKIVLSAGTSVLIPSSKLLTFGDDYHRIYKSIQSNLVIESPDEILLTSLQGVRVTGKILDVGTGTRLYEDNLTGDTWILSSRAFRTEAPVLLGNSLRASNNAAALYLTGGVYIKENLIVSSDSQFQSTLTVGNAVKMDSNATIPLVLTSPSASSGLSLAFSAAWEPSIVGYNIGRGSVASGNGRSMMFTVPTLMNYSMVGNDPQFLFANSNGEVFTSIDKTGMSVTGNLSLSGTFQTTGSAAFTNLTTSGTLQVIDSLLVNNSTIDVKKNMILRANLAVGSVLSVSADNVNVTVPLSILSNLSVSGSTATASLQCNGTATIVGNLDVTGHKVTGLADPTDDTDSANKKYVDIVSAGMSIKESVAAATTANMDVTAPVYSMDGVTLNTGDRILVKNSDPLTNGIYVLNENNIPQRAPDMLIGSDASGAFVFASAGVANGGTGFIIIGKNVQVGTNEIRFTGFTGASQISAGAGLYKSGNTLQVLVDSTTISLNPSSQLQLANGLFGNGLVQDATTKVVRTSDIQSHLTGVGTITSGVWNSSTIIVPYGGTGLQSIPAKRLLFGNDTGALSFDDKFVFNNGALGIGLTSPQSDLHVYNNTFGAWVRIEDGSAGSAKNTGLLIKQNFRSAKISLLSEGQLYIGQDDTTSESSIGFYTQQLQRMSIDAYGNTCIGTSVAHNGSILTVQGDTYFSGDTVASGIIRNNAVTLKHPPGTFSGLYLDSESLVLPVGFDSLMNAQISNFRIESVTGFNDIVSQDRTTRLPIPLRLKLSDSSVSATIFNEGLHIPNTIQLGGTLESTTSAFRFTVSGNALQFLPGVPDMPVQMNGPLNILHSLSFTDSTTGGSAQLSLQNNVFTLNPLGNSTTPITVSTGGSNGSVDMIVKFMNKSGSGYVKFDPTVSAGGDFIIADDTGFIVNNIQLKESIFYGAGNGIDGYLQTSGWFYLGALSVGKTAFSISNVINIVINYDGLTTYNIDFWCTKRDICSFVIYKNIGTFHLFCKVNVAPVHLTVHESNIILQLGKNEGVGIQPNGTFSGYDNTWIKDYDTTSAQATTNIESGTLTTVGRVDVGNMIVRNNLELSGTLQSNGNSTFKGTHFIWNESTNSNKFAELQSNGQNSELNLYSTGLSYAALNLHSGSLNGSMTLRSNSLSIAHNSNDNSSSIVFSTKGNPPSVKIDNNGRLNVLDETDADYLTSSGALTVSGGVYISKGLMSNSIQSKTLRIFNDTFTSSILLSANTNGDLSLGNKKIVDVASPVLPTDVVIKSYVDMAIEGLLYKDAVKAASTGSDIDLNSPITFLDNVPLQNNDRILIKDQTDKITNGVYIVRTGFAPIRSNDLSAGMHAASSQFFVNLGTVNNNTAWVCNSPMGSDVVDVNRLDFVQYSGAATISVGPGIVKNGNRLDLKVDNSSIELSNSGELRVKSSIAGLGLIGGGGTQLSVTSIAHLDTLGTIANGTWNASIIGMAYGGTGSSGFALGRIPVSNGSFLTQSNLYFDAVNSRLGINTLSPVAGLSMDDRDILLSQTLSSPVYLRMSSAVTNYTFATRHDASRLIWSSGSGTDVNSLADKMTLDGSGFLSVTGAISTPYIALNNLNTKFDGTSLENLAMGPLNLSMYSADNSGSYITFYGSMGTSANKANSEFMRCGFFNGGYVLSTGFTGSGTSRDIVLQSGTNTNQLLLKSTGSLEMSGPVTINYTTDSVSAGNLLGVPLTGQGFGSNFDSIPETTGQPITQVKTSNDGRVTLIISEVGHPIVMSNDFGLTFSFANIGDLIANSSFGECKMSLDGKYVLICINYGCLLISSDYGTTWQRKMTDVDRFWEWCSVAPDGQYMLSSTLHDGVFRSYDYGRTWSSIVDAPSDIIDVGFVLISQTEPADQFIGYYGGSLLISHDYGVSFNKCTTVRDAMWYDMYQSRGMHILGIENPGSLFVSADNGSTWTECLSDTARQWIDGGTSAVGNIMAAAAFMGLFYVSTDFGVTWTSVIDTNVRLWQSVIVTADGYLFGLGKMTPTFVSSDAADFVASNTVYDGVWADASFTGSTIVFADAQGHAYISRPAEEDVADYLLESANLSGGALTVLGGGSFAGTLHANKFAVNADTEDAMFVNGIASLGKTRYRGSQTYTISASDSGFLDISGGLASSPSSLQLFSSDAGNNVDVAYRAYGFGKSYAPTSEWLQLGWDTVTQKYTVKSTHGGSGEYRDLNITANGQNQIVLNTDGSTDIWGDLSLSGNFVVTSTIDAQSAVNGGAMTIKGGLSVSKNVILGASLSCPVISCSDYIEFTNGNDSVKVEYTGSGHLNIFNRPDLQLSIHTHDSEGAHSSNQEKVIIGYNDITSNIVASVSTGSGIAKDLILQAGTAVPNQFRLAANGAVNSYGELRCQKTTDSTNFSTGSLVVSGGTAIKKSLYVQKAITVGNASQGALLKLNGTTPWQISQDSDVMQVAAVVDNSTWRFADFNSLPLLDIRESSSGSYINMYTASNVHAQSNAAFTVSNAVGDRIFAVDTVSNVIDCGSSRITNVARPISDNDCCNKLYVDERFSGLQVKQSVKASSPDGVNIDIVKPLYTLDGVQLIAGDRILLSNQENAVENGIYVVMADNLLKRAPDMTFGTKAGGSFVYVASGATKGQLSLTASAGSDIVGTHPLQFSLFSSNSVSTGNGLLKDHTGAIALDIDSSSGLTFKSGKLKIDKSLAGEGLSWCDGQLQLQPISSVGTIVEGTWNGNVIDIACGGTGNNVYSAGGLVYYSEGKLVNNTKLLYINESNGNIGFGTDSPTDGISINSKDIALRSDDTIRLLFGSTDRYNFSIGKNSAGDKLVFNGGNSTSKTVLPELMYLTQEGSLGLGFNQNEKLSEKLNVKGDVYCTGTIRMNVPLSVSSGGIGVQSLAYGLVLSNGSHPLSSTGTLVDGAIPIGSANGKIVLESGGVLRSHLGLGIGINVQAWNTNLDVISSLIPTLGTFIVGDGKDFSTISGDNARNVLGLGKLSVLSDVNNNNWNGTELSVANGGTGKSTFNVDVIPFYDGTSFNDTNVFYHAINKGISINGVTVTAGNGLQVIEKDISVMKVGASSVGYSFQDASARTVWRIHTNTLDEFVISGGNTGYNKYELEKRLSISGSGDISVHGKLYIAGKVTCDTVNVENANVSGSFSVTGECKFDSANISVNELSATSITISGKSVLYSGVVVGQSIESESDLCIVSNKKNEWLNNSPLLDSCRSLLICNSAQDGLIGITLKNLFSGNTWDIIAEEVDDNRLILSSSGQSIMDMSYNSVSVHSESLCTDGNLIVSKDAVINGHLQTGPLSATEITTKNAKISTLNEKLVISNASDISIESDKVKVSLTDSILSLNGRVSCTDNVDVKGSLQVTENIHVKGDLSVTGQIDLSSIVENVTKDIYLDFEDMINVKSCYIRLSSLVNNGHHKDLSINFVVSPTEGSKNTQFTFTLPKLIDNLPDRLAVCSSISGYTNDINLVVLQNMLCVGQKDTKKAIVKFQSVNSQEHYIQVKVSYFSKY